VEKTYKLLRKGLKMGKVIVDGMLVETAGLWGAKFGGMGKPPGGSIWRVAGPISMQSPFPSIEELNSSPFSRLYNFLTPDMSKH